MDRDQAHFARSVEALCDDRHAIQRLSVDELLSSVPRLDHLRLPAGGTVLIRADLDVPVDDGQVSDSTRLRSCAASIQFCLERCAVVLLGHIGRDPSATLEPVVGPLSQIIGRPVTFVRNWFDERSWKVTDELLSALHSDAPKSLVLLENARRYSFEQALWKVDTEGLAPLLPGLFQLASAVRREIAHVEVNEAIAASNRDVSSSVLPLAMEQTGLGFFAHDELTRHARRVISADVLVFGGVKANKLDDLEGIIEQGHVRVLIVGGALALALIKARAQMTGSSVSIGLAESPDHVAYVSPQRVAQAREILTTCRAASIDVHLPSDYVLDDDSVQSAIPEGRSQLDIGPETREQFAKAIRSAANAPGLPARVLFANGTMGRAEEPRFSGGTVAVLEAIAEATASGMETYVGGGEGRAALFKLGFGDRVTHAFTAGGTILKLMSGRPVPYLLAMYMQNRTDLAL